MSVEEQNGDDKPGWLPYVHVKEGEEIQFWDMHTPISIPKWAPKGEAWPQRNLLRRKRGELKQMVHQSTVCLAARVTRRTGMRPAWRPVSVRASRT